MATHCGMQPQRPLFGKSVAVSQVAPTAIRLVTSMIEKSCLSTPIDFQAVCIGCLVRQGWMASGLVGVHPSHWVVWGVGHLASLVSGGIGLIKRV